MASPLLPAIYNEKRKVSEEGRRGRERRKRDMRRGKGRKGGKGVREEEEGEMEVYQIPSKHLEQYLCL